MSEVWITSKETDQGWEHHVFAQNIIGKVDVFYTGRELSSHARMRMVESYHQLLQTKGLL